MAARIPEIMWGEAPLRPASTAGLARYLVRAATTEALWLARRGMGYGGGRRSRSAWSASPSAWYQRNLLSTSPLGRDSSPYFPAVFSFPCLALLQSW